MKLLFCSCNACKAGRKRGASPSMITSIKKTARRKVKQLIKSERYEAITNRVSVPYTD